MISNDTLKIQIFTHEIAYGDGTQIPLATVTIIFPPTLPQGHLLNLQEWIDLVNKTFRRTTITIDSHQVNLDTILQCDWSFFPYALNFLYQKTAYVKSAVIKTLNSSNYWIRFLGRWPLLQFFGKPLTGSTLDPSSDLLLQLRTKQQQQRAKIRSKYNEMLALKQTQEIKSSSIFPSQKNDRLPPQKGPGLYLKCDEVGTFGTFDTEIQQIFPFYATSDGDVQLPIACMKRDAELIISPQQTYIGLYDGYLNDNLNSFSVQLRSNETWIYTNGDCADAHSLHFHMTSGFASPQSNYNSPGLLSCKRLYDPLVYSRDIYQIGPQETASFHLTWPHYSSYDRTKTPAFRGIGGVIHCHFLQHNDANSMIIQYYIDGGLTNSECEKHQEDGNENIKPSKVEEQCHPVCQSKDSLEARTCC
jgi:hypothetical protein